MCHDENEIKLRINAARILGGFFLFGGVAVYFFGKNHVFTGTNVRVYWFGLLVSLIGAGMILFPKAKWVQDGVTRLMSK